MSLLRSEIEKFLSSNALTVHDHKAVLTDIESKFELSENGQSLVRKTTRQQLEGTLTFQIKKILAPSINDRSYGKFVSAFKPGANTDEQKSKVFELVKRSGVVFSDKRAEKYLLDNFVVNGDRINRYDPATGMIAEEPYTVEEVLARVAPTAVDANKTYLNKLRLAAEVKQEATFLAPNDVERVTALLHAERYPPFEAINRERFENQAADLRAKSMAFSGFVDRSDLTLHEINAVEVKANAFKRQLNDLPPLTPAP